MCEFTSKDNGAVFITPQDVSGVEQKKLYTYIYLNNGIKFVVKEPAAEVYFDLKNKFMETLAMGAAFESGFNV